MTITAGGSADPNGTALDLVITNLNTAISAAPAGSVQLAALKTALGQAQTAAVFHYLSTGRISGAKVLSTLSVSAAQLADAALGVTGANLVNRTATLTTASQTAGPQQNTAVQALAQAQTETVACLLNAGVISAAQVLSSLS